MIVPKTDHYAALYASFQWWVPSRLNIADACLHRWTENPSDARKPALYVDNSAQTPIIYTYQQLSDASKRLSSGLLKMGVQTGERVAIGISPESQPFEFITALMAVLGVQAIAVPLAGHLSPAQQRQCLRDAQVRIALADAACGAALLQSPSIGGLQIVGLGFAHEHIVPWHTLLARQSTHFMPEPTLAQAQALLCYSSLDNRLTGQLFTHSALLGSLPGVVCAQNWFVQPGLAHGETMLWSSLDWRSVPGLLVGLLPSLYLGHTVFAANLSADAALHDALIRHHVTHLLLDTDRLGALGAIENAAQSAPSTTSADNPASVRSIALHVDPTTTLPENTPSPFGIAPNIIFSLPQTCALIGQARQKWASQPGSIGRVYPGHLATVLDERGLPCPAGITGELVVNRYDVQGHPDPAWSSGVWQAPTGTSNSRSSSHPTSTPAPVLPAVLPASGRLHTGLPARMNRQGDLWLGSHDDAHITGP